MPVTTAMKAPLRGKHLPSAGRRKTLRPARAVRSRGLVPASFLQGLKDIKEGRVMDLDQALREPPPGHAV